MRSVKMRALLTIAALALTAGAVQAGGVYLGITMSPITSSMARALQLDEDEGVLIDEVVADSPAAAAGIEPGDVIVAIDDQSIAGSKGLAKAIRRYEPEDEVTVTVVRAGDRRDLKVVLGERKSHGYTVWTNDDGDTKVWSWSPGPDGEGVVTKGGKTFYFRGGDGENKVVLEGFGLNDRGFLGIVPGEVDGDRDGDRGVLVAELVEDGPAEHAGLRGGDVIVRLDDETIDDGDDLHDFLAETEPGETVTVQALRDGKKKSFEVELGAGPGTLKLADIYAPGQRSQPQFYSGTIAPPAELEKLDRERQDVEKMKQELEELKAELQALRKELEEKK